MMRHEDEKPPPRCETRYGKAVPKGTVPVTHKHVRFANGDNHGFAHTWHL